VCECECECECDGEYQQVFQGDEHMFSIDYADLPTSTSVGNLVLIADGNISLTITAIDLEKRLAVCRVNNTAVLGSTKNVHLPGATITLPALQEKGVFFVFFVCLCVCVFVWCMVYGVWCLVFGVWCLCVCVCVCVCGPLCVCVVCMCERFVACV